MANGLFLIVQERNRQTQIYPQGEGYTAEHDKKFMNGELMRAAICYLAICLPNWLFDFHGVWPWDEEYWKPKSKIRNLVRAGALIAAEIDRLIALDADDDHPQDRST